MQCVDLVMIFTVVDFPVLVEPTIITQACVGVVFGFSFSGFRFSSSMSGLIFWLLCSRYPPGSRIGLNLSRPPFPPGRLETCAIRRPNMCLQKLPDFSPYLPVQFGLCFHSTATAVQLTVYKVTPFQLGFPTNSTIIDVQILPLHKSLARMDSRH